MAKTKYIIQLTGGEKQRLTSIIEDASFSERAIVRAKILLLSDADTEGKMPVSNLADFLGTTHTTIQTVRSDYCTGGLDAAVFRKKRSDNIETRRINRKVREQIILMSKENPPEGHKRWSLRLLCKEAEERGIIDHISVKTMHVIMSEQE